jgi:hypothetical protein
MLGEAELVGLLYRADWTRLNLSASYTGVTVDGPERAVVTGWPPSLGAARWGWWRGRGA